MGRKDTIASHDIFGTPENESFFSTKPYSNLNPTRREIRLLKILPGEGNSLVRCKLLPKARLVDVQGRYTAISYCAGNSKRTGTILVNGTICNVFANLMHAIIEARRFWLQKHGRRSFLLWVDQICINQKDVRERSHQVKFMRDIYEQAKQVLVCLSTSDGSPEGMRWLRELARKVPICENDADAQPWTRHEEPQADDFHRNRLLQHIFREVPKKDFTEGWKAFYDVIESPWWERAWVFQEFVVATEVHMLYRGVSVCWEEVWPVLRSLVDLHQNEVDSRYFRQNWVGGGKRLADHECHRMAAMFERLVSVGAREALDRVHSMGHSRAVFKNQLDLKDLLVHSRHCRTSDPRDKVYAFLGLADPGYEIQPDYSQPATKVLVETTRKILMYENSLDVLIHAPSSCISQYGALPSWVVDWTQKERCR